MKKPTIETVRAYFSGKKLPRKKKKTVLTYQRCSNNDFVANEAMAMFQEELANIN